MELTQCNFCFCINLLATAIDKFVSISKKRSSTWRGSSLPSPMKIKNFLKSFQSHIYCVCRKW